VSELVAAHKCGFSTQIPSDFFRQLVLCLWDCKMIDAGGGEEDGLRNSLGVTRINDLALAIVSASSAHQHEGTSHEALVEKDNLLLSLLCLLSFENSSSPSSTSTTATHTDTTAAFSVCKLIAGIALRSALLAPTGKPRAPPTSESTTNSSVDSSVTYRSVLRLVDRHDKDSSAGTSSAKSKARFDINNSYVSIIHILAKDTTQTSSPATSFAALTAQ